MRRLLVITVVTLGTLGAFAQAPGAIGGPEAAQQVFNGFLYANAFGAWSIPQGDAGQFSWNNRNICSNLSGFNFQLLVPGLPITIVDANPANSESTTINTVSILPSGCSITTAPLVRSHFSFRITSGTFGLQEAINYAKQNNITTTIFLSPSWSRLGGTTGMITSAQGNANIGLVDQRNTLYKAYAWNGSAYAQQGMGGFGITNIDAIPIGQSTPAAGSFTSFQTNGTNNLTQGVNVLADSPSTFGGSLFAKRFEGLNFGEQFCGGSTDISTCATNAFNDCVFLCTVIIPKGTYTASSSITIPLNTTGRARLSMYGAGVTYTASGCFVETTEVSANPSSSNLIIEGGVIHGTSSGKCAFHILPQNGAMIRDTYVDGFSTGDCTIIEGSILITVENNYWTGCKNQLHAFGTKCLTSNPFTCSPTQAGTTNTYAPNGIRSRFNIYANATANGWGVLLDSQALGDAFQILKFSSDGDDYEGNSGTGAGGIDVQSSEAASITNAYFEGNAAHNVKAEHGANNLQVHRSWFTTSPGIPSEIELISAPFANIDGNSEGGGTPSTCFVDSTVSSDTLYMGINHTFTSSNNCVAHSAGNPTGLFGFDNSNRYHAAGFIAPTFGFFLDGGSNRAAIQGTTVGGEIVDNPLSQTLATWNNGGGWSFRGTVTPLAVNASNLGSVTIPWVSLFLGASATNNVQLGVVGSVTASRLASFPDATGTVLVTGNGKVPLQTSRVAGCTTAASIGGICATDITIPWANAFADASYTVTCVGANPTGVPSNPYIVNGTQLAASIHVNYFAITASSASFAQIQCTAVHD